MAARLLTPPRPAQLRAAHRRVLARALASRVGRALAVRPGRARRLADLSRVPARGGGVHPVLERADELRGQSARDAGYEDGRVRAAAEVQDQGGGRVGPGNVQGELPRLLYGAAAGAAGGARGAVG